MQQIEEMPGHLVRRLQQIAVAIFHAEVSAAGFDLTSVQYAALSKVNANPGIDQVTLAGLTRKVSETDRRARILEITKEGKAALEKIQPAVLETQKIMLSGLSVPEQEEFMRLLEKATSALNDLSRAPLKAAKTEEAAAK